MPESARAAPIRGIVFDLDNTLYDRDGHVRRWLEGLFPGATALVEEGMAFDNSGFIPRGEFYQWVLDRADWAEEPGEVKARFYREILPAIEPRPDVTASLERLARRFMLGLLTNGEAAYQLAKFRALQIDHLFAARCVFATGDLGFHKPHPRAFQAVIDALNVPPETILFVGDNPVNDILGAAQAGMQTAWIRLADHHRCEIEPTWTLRSLLELEDHLAQASSV